MRELWAIMQYVAPTRFGTMRDFLEEYGEITSATQVQKLQKLLGAPTDRKRKRKRKEGERGRKKGKEMQEGRKETQAFIYQFIPDLSHSLILSLLSFSLSLSLSLSLFFLSLSLFSFFLSLSLFSLSLSLFFLSLSLSPLISPPPPLSFHLFTIYLAPHLLRRVKENVEKSIPLKTETVIDVELTTLQKQYYRALYERNRVFLLRGSQYNDASGSASNGGGGGADTMKTMAMPKLINLEVELRKCCNHPFLLTGVEDTEVNRKASYKERFDALIKAR